MTQHGLYVKGKQIRIFVTSEAYKKIKQEARENFMTLAQYAGIKLSGYKLVKEGSN